jgi:ABC-2 type transport system permease protein
MIRILDIALKDLLQLTRDFKTFMFLFIMPIAFTFLFGFAFGGFSKSSESRIPVGFIDQDESRVSRTLRELLADSSIIKMDENGKISTTDLEKLVADGKLAAGVIIPQGYGKAILANKTVKLIVFRDSGTSTWTTIQAELLGAISRVDNAVSTASILERISPDRIPFKYGYAQSLAAWKDPPISVKETTSSVVAKASGQVVSLAHTSPGMMLQFAIAGLLTAAQVIVTERKSRTFQRLLTTATQRVHIVLGHYLAIFCLVFSQFILLILFGALVLKIGYLRVPHATFLVAVTTALCISALGLLIGIFARTEEQAVMFSLIPMFVFAGLGGAWVPLEFTGEVFRTIGHVSPIAWAMDGFKNISVRGFGFESVLLPAGALLLYAVILFSLAVWRLNTSEEK